MKDQFANYVVQKVLETCNDQQRDMLLGRIRVHLHALKKYTYGKHIVARVEKLVAAGGKYKQCRKSGAKVTGSQISGFMFGIWGHGRSHAGTQRACTRTGTSSAEREGTVAVVKRGERRSGTSNRKRREP